ncbi:hypothetical protein L1987_88846 [Smallanthus sonchifolius]|nr:hypothetical protein L1987_88846 [Smallanthus sonchifolius]
MGKNLASKETKKKTKKISIIVRRPSLKWNFHAGARTSMKVDLLQTSAVVRISFSSSKPFFLRKALTELLTESSNLEADYGPFDERASKEKRAGGRSTVRAQCSGIASRFDKGRMPGRRSSTVVSRASFLVDQFASALLKGLHSYGGFVNEPVDKKSFRKNWKTLVCTVTLSSATGGLLAHKGRQEATFLSALFKRLASARKRRQGHKVSEVASLSQEGPIRIPPLFPFPSAPFPRNEKEDGTLELYYLSAYCLPKILLLQLVGHRVIQISRVFRGFPMLQLPYQFGRSGMDRLNIPLGEPGLDFSVWYSFSFGSWNHIQQWWEQLAKSNHFTLLHCPPTLSRTSIETEWFMFFHRLVIPFPFVSLSPISVSISSQD